MDWPAFYLPRADGTFEATGASAGPWDPGLQHGGPPSALLARAMEAEPSPVPQRLARLTVEILRAVPVGRLSIRAETVRPGKKVALVEATGSVDGVECLRARGWRIEVPTLPGPVLEHPKVVPAIPDHGEAAAWDGAYLGGYMGAIEWRPTSGSMAERGPADVWARARFPLIAGESTSPFCRAALLADSGSGVGLSFDLGKIFAINVDLTLLMWRDIAGEWIFMSARTLSASAGAGMAETDLGDESGIAGKVLQTMVVAGR